MDPSLGRILGSYFRLLLPHAGYRFTVLISQLSGPHTKSLSSEWPLLPLRISRGTHCSGSKDLDTIDIWCNHYSAFTRSHRWISVLHYCIERHQSRNLHGQPPTFPHRQIDRSFFYSVVWLVLPSVVERIHGVQVHRTDWPLHSARLHQSYTLVPLFFSSSVAASGLLRSLQRSRHSNIHGDCFLFRDLRMASSIRPFCLTERWRECSSKHGQ